MSSEEGCSGSTMKTTVIVAAAILSAIIDSVQAEEVTLQSCETLHEQFLSGVARKIYALPNAVVCENVSSTSSLS